VISGIALRILRVLVPSLAMRRRSFSSVVLSSLRSGSLIKSPSTAWTKPMRSWKPEGLWHEFQATDAPERPTGAHHRRQRLHRMQPRRCTGDTRAAGVGCRQFEPAWFRGARTLAKAAAWRAG